MGWKGCKVRAWGVMCIGGVMGVSHRWHLCGAVCVQGDEVWVCRLWFAGDRMHI